MLLPSHASAVCFSSLRISSGRAHKPTVEVVERGKTRTCNGMCDSRYRHRVVIHDVVSFYVLAFVAPQYVTRMRSCSYGMRWICDYAAADCFVQRSTTIRDGASRMEVDGRFKRIIASLRHATLACGSRDTGLTAARIISWSAARCVAFRFIRRHFCPQFQPGTCHQLQSLLFDTCDDKALAHVANARLGVDGLLLPPDEIPHAPEQLVEGDAPAGGHV